MSRELTILGGGMAGLCAAARARELGLGAVVHEKGDRPGGSMLLSSCVVWRYCDLDAFREECPNGDLELQRRVIELLDEGLQWLLSLGADVVWDETGNPLTVGMRFDPKQLTETLVGAAGEVRLSAPWPEDAESLLLATGGFQGNPELVARYIAPAGDLLLRANPWSTGDGLRFALRGGAALSDGMNEFFGRAMPAPPAVVTEEQFVDLAQLYGRYALVLDDDGEEFAPEPVHWSETDLVQAMAHRPHAQAWYLVDEDTLEVHIRERTVRQMIEAARGVGGEVVLPYEFGVEVPDAYRYGVHVIAGITHTIGGIRIDPSARVLREDGTPIDGLYAAGADAGGISTGGYSSGLASALVFGRIAAETAASGT
jgi:succinate dehydrogenase/fumarate reductase flavoprotein subunit